MTKSKKEGSRKGGRKGEAVKCPHLHFKEDVIDRNVISRQQYLDLLCTPKGYRWQVGDGEPKPFEEVMARGPRKIVCSGRRLRKPERTYVHNFLAEVWALLTPEMVDRLKGMLMNEFGMTPEEANTFLRDQAKTTGSGDAKKEKARRKMNRCDEETPMHIKKHLQKQFETMARDMFEEKLISLICGPRSKRHVDLSEQILENLTDIVGEKCTLQTPQTQLQRIMVFTADQAAGWLSNVVDDADAQLVKKLENKLHGLSDEGGKGDGLGEQKSDEDIEIITKKKMPKGWKDFVSKTEAMGDAEEKPLEPTKKDKTTKKSKGESDKTDATQEEEKKTSSRVASKKTTGSRPTSPAKKETPQKKETPKKKETPPKKETPQKKETPRNSQTPKRKQSDSGSKRGTTKPYGQSATISKRTSKEDKPLNQEGTDSKSKLEKPASSRTSGARMSRGKSPQPQPKTDSEVKRDLMKTMIGDHVMGVVSEQDNKGQTSRQTALKDVISKRLEEKLVPSPTDGKTIDAIKEVAGLISTYVDNVTSKVELDYGTKTPAANQTPLAQRGAGTVYSVRKAGSLLSLRAMTHTQAKVKVNLARGLPLPANLPADYKNNDSKDVVKWADDVAAMAENWGKWIGSTVLEAVKVGEDRKKGVTQDKETWKQWKDVTGAQALEWRRNKKLVDAQAQHYREAENLEKP